MPDHEIEQLLCESVAVPDFTTQDLDAWLVEQAHQYGYKWLLAHMDDQVIWGIFKDHGLYLPPGIESKLRAETLQQLRIFGQAGELFVWRTPQGFAARKALSKPPQDGVFAVKQERYMLWGEAKHSTDGFSLLSEGQQGLVQTAPLEISKGKRAGLEIEHYITYDLDGQAYIAFSRLVGLSVWEDSAEVQ